jgi:hypothetical protein
MTEIRVQNTILHISANHICKHKYRNVKRYKHKEFKRPTVDLRMYVCMYVYLFQN